MSLKTFIKIFSIKFFTIETFQCIQHHHQSVIIENNNSLPFLDVNICLNSNKFDTKVFRKSTFTGLGTSFFSHCYFNFKLNSIKTLVYRAYHICSSYANFHCEIEYLKTFFSE